MRYITEENEYRQEIKARPDAPPCRLQLPGARVGERAAGKRAICTVQWPRCSASVLPAPIRRKSIVFISQNNVPAAFETEDTNRGYQCLDCHLRASSALASAAPPPQRPQPRSERHVLLHLRGNARLVRIYRIQEHQVQE